MLAVALAARVAWAQAAGAAAAAPGSEDVLYEDPTGASSATISQVLPNSSKETLIVDHLRRVRVKQEILIIEWGGTAVTLLPRQYVGSITINKRIDAAATQPAKPADVKR